MRDRARSLLLRRGGMFGKMEVKTYLSLEKNTAGAYGFGFGRVCGFLLFLALMRLKFE